MNADELYDITSALSRDSLRLGYRAGIGVLGLVVAYLGMADYPIWVTAVALAIGVIGLVSFSAYLIGMVSAYRWLALDDEEPGTVQTQKPDPHSTRPAPPSGFVYGERDNQLRRERPPAYIPPPRSNLPPRDTLV